MKIDLTEKEIEFIWWATLISDGVFDYENHNERSFKAQYGMTKAASKIAVANLENKIRQLRNQKSLEKT